VGLFLEGARETTAGISKMKSFIAACIAVGVLWVVDAEMNGGRYGDVIKKAVMSVLPR
jgi:hypothetical protein